ncbi:MAG TPA: hypothetical protein VOA41_08855 [Candidatus Dormibacteraeota bacterium]|nr:hypothetical protein [Candidatus Dormibacteraeota bacterium]
MKKLLLSMAGLLLCGLIGVQVHAAKKHPNKTKKTRSITGCLRQGDSANEYVITGKDGSTWDLESESVSLSPHVGHTVTIAGAVSHAKLHAAKEKTKEEMKEHGMKKSDREHGRLMVTNVTMVSESCTP